jgi:hypothetical protein
MLLQSSWSYFRDVLNAILRQADITLIRVKDLVHVRFAPHGIAFCQREPFSHVFLREVLHNALSPALEPIIVEQSLNYAQR